MRQGLVIATHGRHALVRTAEGAALRCHLRGKGKTAELVVGDRVAWQPAGDEGVIEALLPRRNLLHRQDAWRSKSFAANLDQILMLLAVEPMWSEAQLARALIAAGHADIPVRVVLNKVDLPGAEAMRARLQPYRAMGVEVLELALKPRPQEAQRLLAPLLHGRVSLVLGPSGMGKSSLVNLMVPEAQAQVGEISQALNSGRHTTTATRWYRLEPVPDGLAGALEERSSQADAPDRGHGGFGQGAGAAAAEPAPGETALIDSPGFQAFGLHHIPAEALARAMPDFAAAIDAAGGCRFLDCRHRQEPGCAVTAAVAEGRISASRHRIYLGLLDELAAASAW